MKTLWLASLLLISSGTFAKEKYHSSEDAEVEFSLEEKTEGPKPFYIDKEAIEKAKRQKLVKEQKDAQWMAKRISLFLKGLAEQRIAEQHRRVLERNYIAQNALNDIQTDNPEILAQAEQARALLKRAEAEARAVAALQQTHTPTRNIASVDQPLVIKLFKGEPKRKNAKKLWAKFNKKLFSKFQQAALYTRNAGNTALAASGQPVKNLALVSRKIAPAVSSSIPLALQTNAQRQAARQIALQSKTSVSRFPASLKTAPNRPQGQAAFTQGLRNAFDKVSKVINQLKTKLFSW